MPRNIKRGFNRLFVVLTMGWALYCLFVIPMQRKNDAMSLYFNELNICSSHHVAGEDPTSCATFVQNTFGPEVDRWALFNYFKGYWLYILIAVTLVPLAVYGLLRVLALLGVWVYHGYSG